jgi:hypothetical protein
VINVDEMQGGGVSHSGAMVIDDLRSRTLCLAGTPRAPRADRRAGGATEV